jgi:type IV pilus assembly protein PilQ
MRSRFALITLIVLSSATVALSAMTGVRRGSASPPAAPSLAAAAPHAWPDAGPAAAPGAASRLESVSVSSSGGRTRITIRGNGELVPAAVEEARDLPPRVLADFPGVAPAVPAVTPVNQGPVRRIRVAANSHDPLVTRVVVDLTRKTSYEVQKNGSEVVLLIPEDAPVPAPASAAAPTSGPAPAGASKAAPKAAAPARAPAPTTNAAVSAPAPAPAKAAMAAPAEGRPAASPAAAPSPAARTAAPAPPAPAAAGRAEPAEAAPDAEKAEAPDRTPRAPAPGDTPTPAATRPATAPAASPAPAAAPQAPAAQPAQQPPAGSQPKAAAPQPSLGAQAEKEGERKFSGHPVSLDFQGVDLRAVLRTFAEITGLNIVIDPSVQGTVDVALREVPWDQALDIILRANQLGYSVEGTIVRIAPLSKLREEQDERRKLAEAQALSGQLETLTRTLSYAKADEMVPLLTRAALTQRGSIQVDKRTNTLIIRDLPSALAASTQLIDTLDTPQPQVEIEARIVQTNRNFLRELGVRWGLQAEASQRLGNALPLTFPNQAVVTGRTTRQTSDDQGNSVTIPTGSVVDLPVSPATSAIGLAIGSINGAFNLDVELSAAEQSGQLRVLSTPRVSTQNNVEAEIAQGTQIPIQTVANNTVTVQFKDATLTLKVRPQITSANTVILNVTLENAVADFTRQVNGIPPIDTQRATTQVQVNDGATTIIGGIFVSSERTVNDRTPGLHRIPLLGWLFKSDQRSDQSQELLIFLTPRIIKS